MIDKIAKQEACQLFIEQEIAKGLNTGKSKYAIGKEVSQWLKEKLGISYKAQTISKRAQRIAIGTNVPKPKPPAKPKAPDPVPKKSSETLTEAPKSNLESIKELWARLKIGDQERFWNWVIDKEFPKMPVAENVNVEVKAEREIPINTLRVRLAELEGDIKAYTCTNMLCKKRTAYPTNWRKQN